MKAIYFGIIILLATTFSSCEKKAEESTNAMILHEAPAMESRMQAPPMRDKVDGAMDNIKPNTESEPKVASKKKIIKDGSISVKTNDIAASKKSIDEALKKYNAYYETEDLQNNDQTTSYDLKIRIPAQNFESLIAAIENGKDEIKSKSIQARDVTEEYFDIETRLNNKREYLKRYKQLLLKASTVEDILKIEESIRVLHEEIESAEGRLKYLSDQVAFSTLSLNLYKEKEYIYKPQQQDKFSERFKKSLSRGWTSLVDFLLWTIAIWPFVIIIGGIVFIIRRRIKKRKSQQKN